MRASIFDHAGLPNDTELRTALRDDMEWALANVLRYAGPEDIPAAPPVPRWTWDGLSGSTWAQRRPSRRSPPDPRS